MMNALEALSEMDPAARAIAEFRAREAGLSLGQLFEALVFQHLTSLAGGPHSLRAGRTPSVFLSQGSSLTSSVVTRPEKTYDLDVGIHWTAPWRMTSEGSDADRMVVEMETDETWSAVRMIAAFPPRISHAAILLSAAFAEADVDFRAPAYRQSRRRRTGHPWYLDLVDTSLRRSQEVRNALVHHWTPSGRAERLWDDAFLTLCDLSPARHELLILFGQDRTRASAELARHLEVATEQFKLSAHLLAEVELSAEPSDEQNFDSIRGSLLERAGGGFSLTQGADLLGISRQALHKRIRNGGALGMMDGDEIVLPRLQFTEGAVKAKILAGVPQVVKLFKDAGGWSALQFLVDPDPNLARSPVDALRKGQVEAVVAAARAFLGLDEG